MESDADRGASSSQNTSLTSTRSLLLLSFCYFLGTTALFAHVSATNVAAKEVAKSDQFATIPLSFMIGGSAVIIAPAGALMHHFGYKSVFLLGTILGAIGAAMCGFGLFVADPYLALGLLSLGTLPQGFAYGIVHYYRHAGAILGRASEALGAKFVAIVITGGMLAGITGPAIADLTVHLIPGRPYSGTYFAISLVNLFHLAVLSLTSLNIPHARGEADNSGGRSLLKIIRQPAYIFPMLIVACCHSSMVLLMGLAPLILKGRVDFALSSLIIQIHVVSMYLPSFLTSKVIALGGALRIALFGVALTISGVLIYFGDTFPTMLASLMVIGLGWNLSFVGGTAALSSTYQTAEKFKAQACNDTVVFGCGATVTLLSGFLLHHFGIRPIGYGAVAVLTVVFVAGLGYVFATRPKGTVTVGPSSADKDTVVKGIAVEIVGDVARRNTDGRRQETGTSRV